MCFNTHIHFSSHQSAVSGAPDEPESVVADGLLEPPQHPPHVTSDIRHAPLYEDEDLFQDELARAIEISRLEEEERQQKQVPVSTTSFAALSSGVESSVKVRPSPPTLDDFSGFSDAAAVPQATAAPDSVFRDVLGTIVHFHVEPATHVESIAPSGTTSRRSDWQAPTVVSPSARGYAPAPAPWSTTAPSTDHDREVCHSHLLVSDFEVGIICPMFCSFV